MRSNASVSVIGMLLEELQQYNTVHGKYLDGEKLTIMVNRELQIHRKCIWHMH